MGTLTETLQDPARLGAVAADGAELIDAEVRRKSGVSGFALKTTYKAVQAMRPGMIPGALRRLLPQFAPRIDPYYARARDSGDTRGYFVAHGDEIAEAMLAVTDERAARTSHRSLKRAYEGLRGRAKAHVVEAMPGLAELIDKHVP